MSWSLSGARRAAASLAGNWASADGTPADHTDTPEFRDAMTRLLGHEDRSTAIMCAETLWWNCHRRLISDAAVVRGADVVHLVDAQTHQRHVRHPSLRVYKLEAVEPELWSASASDVLRITFRRVPGGRKLLVECSRHYDR